MEIKNFKEYVWTDAFETTLEKLYGPEQVETQRIRYLNLLSRFQEVVPEVEDFDVYCDARVKRANSIITN